MSDCPEPGCDNGWIHHQHPMKPPGVIMGSAPCAQCNADQGKPYPFQGEWYVTTQRAQKQVEADGGGFVTRVEVPPTALGTLAEAAYYPWPEIRRGPADPKWVQVMKDVSELLSWPKCTKCQGTGELIKPPQHVNVMGQTVKDPLPTLDICCGCRAIGRVHPEDV